MLSRTMPWTGLTFPVKVGPHVVDKIRQHHRFLWKLVEILANAYAIGIQVLFEKIIKMATSQRHLARALKILSADTNIHRIHLKVSVFWI